jgi:hypothetical protein
MWHEKLSEALWAHRTSRHRATKVTPFELVYDQEADQDYKEVNQRQPKDVA